MMRWNSTKTYTEDDILRMQQEAVNRVHDFQTRARSIPFYDVPDNAITPYPGPSPWSQEAIPADSGGFRREASPSSFYEIPPEPMPVLEGEARDVTPDTPQPVQQAPQSPAKPSDPFSSLLSGLNIDTETMLILGLMFLLYNEKADNFLLMALAYLLL